MNSKFIYCFLLILLFPIIVEASITGSVTEIAYDITSRPYYITETPTVNSYIENTGTESYDAYVYVYVYAPDGTEYLYESVVFTATPDGNYYFPIDYSYLSIEGIGEYSVKTQLWRKIFLLSDELLDEETSTFEVIFNPPTGYSNYLSDDTWHHPSDSLIRDWALYACCNTAGKTTTSAAAQALKTWVYYYITYTHNYECDGVNANCGDRSIDYWIIYDEKGDCNDFADLYTSFARALNIPTGYTVGYKFEKNPINPSWVFPDYGPQKLYEPTSGDYWGHAWAESYLSSWKHVDPTWNEYNNPSVYDGGGAAHLIVRKQNDYTNDGDWTGLDKWEDVTRTRPYDPSWTDAGLIVSTKGPSGILLVGGNISVNATIYHSGDMTARNSQVLMSKSTGLTQIGGTGSSYEDLENIDWTNSDLLRTWYFKLTNTGSKTVTITVDSDDTISSSSSQSFTVYNGPNLTISQSVPSTASTLVNFTITTTVTNNGDLEGYNIGTSLNLPSGLTILSGATPQYFNLSAGNNGTAMWVVNAAEGIKTYSNIYTSFSSVSYDKLFSGASLSNSIEVVLHTPLQGSGSTVYNCSNVDSVLGIGSVSKDSELIAGEPHVLTINWTGWHFYNNNHWAFFLDDATTPIDTCISYNSDSKYNAYTMNCTINIPSNTSTGTYDLKITANDYMGYCKPNELGVDAQYTLTSNILNIDNDEDGSNYTIDCNDNDPSILAPYDGMNITRNITFCEGKYNLPNGITIASNNIDLNCNNSILIGAGSNKGISLSWLSGVTIRNCNIQNYDGGIYLDSSSNNNISNNVIFNNSGGYGIEILWNSYDNLIENNNISSNRGCLPPCFATTRAGLYINGWNFDTNQDNIIKNNLIDRNDNGIHISTTNYNNISNNTIYNNAFQNLEVQQASYNDFWNNTFSGSRIWFYSSSENNSFWNNHVYDLSNSWNYPNNSYCINNVSNNYYNGATGPSCPVSIDSFYPSESTINIAEPNNQTFNITKSDIDGTIPSVQWYKNGDSIDGETNDVYTFIGNYSLALIYNITVIVTDNYSTDSHTWIMNVNNTNRAPNILSYHPTELIVNIAEPNNQIFNITYTDPDGDSVNVGWYKNGSNVGTMSEYEFEGGYFSSGNYNISVVINDTLLTDSRLWLLIINNTNRCPILNSISDITVNETDLVDIKASGEVTATDPDGDGLTFSYTSPLNSSGQWLTTTQDAGIYHSVVTVNDSICDDSQNVTITVLNVQDTDGDNIPDKDDTDDDNDGIDDGFDMLLGNSSNINSSTVIPVIEIDGDDNLSQQFTGVKNITIKDNDKPIVEFEFNFSQSMLSLPNITLEKENSTAEQGATLIKGISLPVGITKTVYVSNKNNLTYLCIKDAEISSITQISSLCNGADEYGIKCPGTANNNKYNCSYSDSTNTSFRVTGLEHTGIQQQNYCGDSVCNSGESCSSCSSDCGACPLGDTGDGGGGGGGGGGSGGGGGGTAATNPNEASRFFASLTEAYHALMAINSPNISIDRLSFNVNKQLFMVRVNVKALDESSTPVRISGKVYQYIELSTENLNDSDLSQPAEIKFKVSKEWLNQKEVDKEEIFLYRYEGKWNKLDTEIEREDNATVYYVSKTPGFSIFAIAATKEAREIKESKPIEEKVEEVKEVPAITEIEGGKIEEEEGGFFVITGRVIGGAYKERPLTMGLLTVFILMIGILFVYTHAKDLKHWPFHFKHKEKKWLIPVIIFIILAVIFIYLVNTTGKYDEFAKCLSDKGIVMYASENCRPCEEQNKMFGSSAEYLSYKDCTDMTICKDVGVEGVPSWLINDTIIKGKQTLEILSELSGCNILTK